MAFVNFPDPSEPDPKTCPHAPPASCIWGDHCRCKQTSSVFAKLFQRRSEDDSDTPSLSHVPNPQPSGTANPVAAEGPTEAATGPNIQAERGGDA